MDRDEVAHLDFDFALVVLEFLERHEGFRLQTGVDHHVVVVDAHDFGGDDFARAHFSALEGLFKQGGKRFRHVFSCAAQRRSPEVKKETLGSGFGVA